MYVILLAAAGVSVLMVSLWMRKKERAEEEEERLSFLEKEEEASRTSEEKPIHQPDKPIHQPAGSPIQPAGNRREESFLFGKTEELPDAYRSRPETSVNQRPQRTEPDRKPENREEESGSIDHLLCQKTEPLFMTAAERKVSSGSCFSSGASGYCDHQGGDNDRKAEFCRRCGDSVSDSQQTSCKAALSRRVSVF